MDHGGRAQQRRRIPNRGMRTITDDKPFWISVAGEDQVPQRNPLVCAIRPHVERIEHVVILGTVFGWRDFPREQPRVLDPVRVHVRDQATVVLAVPEDVLVGINNARWLGHSKADSGKEPALRQPRCGSEPKHMGSIWTLPPSENGWALERWLSPASFPPLWGETSPRARVRDSLKSISSVWLIAQGERKPTDRKSTRLNSS